MNNSTLLLHYLDNELPLEEVEQLEKRLAVDADLKKEWDDLRLSRELIRYNGLCNQVAVIHKEMMRAKEKAPVIALSSRRRGLRYLVGTAAAIILLVGGYLVFNNMNLTPEKVFASHYERYELVTLRDNGQPETAMEAAYRSRDYAEVLRIHNVTKPITARDEFLCGAASLETKDNQKAIKCFREVFSLSPDPLLKEETEYYLSLAYVRNREYDKALALLNTIRDNPEHLYNGKVTGKLIRQVSRLNG